MSDPTITQRVIANARKRGLTVLDRDDWGSTRADVYDYRRRTKPAKQPADTVVQHITVTLDTGPLTGDFAADVRTVERIGYERFKSGVSYNWVVDMSTGMVAAGQPLDAKGTHTVNDKGVSGYSYDQNYVARAIAVLGMENTPLSDKAEAAIATLIAAMIDEGAVTDHFDYDPHSKFAWKDCPCDATRNRMDEIRASALRQVKQQPKPRPAPVVKVTGIDTLRLGSDHRAVIYRLTLDGKPWMVGTYNMGGKAEGVDVQHLVARLDAMSPGRWTLALQETGDQGKTLRHVVATTPGVELVQGPEGLGRAKLATIVPAGTLERHALVKLTDRTFVGPKGAGGLYTDHKYLLRTRQEVDGTVVRVGNVHLMSSVQGPPTPWRAVRRALHRKQLAGAIEWVGKPTVPTVVVGDWNAVPTSPLMDPLRKAGLKIHGRGSHGGPKKNRRAIDLLVHP